MALEELVAAAPADLSMKALAVAAILEGSYVEAAVERVWVAWAPSVAWEALDQGEVED